MSASERHQHIPTDHGHGVCAACKQPPPFTGQCTAREAVGLRKRWVSVPVTSPVADVAWVSNAVLNRQDRERGAPVHNVEYNEGAGRPCGSW